MNRRGDPEPVKGCDNFNPTQTNLVVNKLKCTSGNDHTKKLYVKLQRESSLSVRHKLLALQEVLVILNLTVVQVTLASSKKSYSPTLKAVLLSARYTSLESHIEMQMRGHNIASVGMAAREAQKTT